MKKIMLLGALLVLLIAPASLAQNQRVQATLTVADSGSCGVAVPTSGSSLSLGLNSNSGATVIQASDPAGTFTGTIQFQRTADGTNWVTAPSTDATPVTSATAPGAWQVNVAGYQAVRACLSNQSAGSLTVVITSSVASAATHGGSGSGSGTVNAGLAHQPAFYPASGTAVSGTCTVPATNGQFPMLFNVTADAAVDPSCPQSGFVNTPITGAATTYTIKSADNLQGIEHDVAGSQSVTYSLPTPTTLENLQFAIPQICNYSTHTDTLTPVTWTVNGAVSVSIAPSSCHSLSIDPFNTTNWLAPLTGAAPGGGPTSLSASSLYTFYMSSTADCLSPSPTATTEVCAKNNNTGVIDYSGTDAAVVVNNALGAFSTVGGRLFFKDGVYPINSMTAETATGCSNFNSSGNLLAYAFGIPSNTTIATSVQWIIEGEASGVYQGEAASVTVNNAGVIFNVTPTAVSSVAANSVLVGWWQRPVSSCALNANTFSNDTNNVYFKNAYLRFPTNQRGNTLGFAPYFAIQVGYDNVGAGFNLTNNAIATGSAPVVGSYNVGSPGTELEFAL